MKYTRGTQITIAVIFTTDLVIGCSGVDDGVNCEESNTELAATSNDFDRWTAHPEVGRGEHGPGGENGEHN